MKGLFVVWILAGLGAVVAPLYPVVGLTLYIMLALMRPESIWGLGAFPYISFVTGVAMLVGWALRGTGDWRLGRAWPAILGLLGFWLCLVVSAAFAPRQWAAWPFVNLISKMILPVLIGVTCIKTTRELKTLVWVIVIAVGYVSWEMNLSYFQGYNRAQWDGFGDMDRAVFATMLVTILWLAVALFLDAKKTWQKGVAAVAALLIFHTILLTFSRGGLLAVIVSGFVAVLTLRKRAVHYLFIAVAIVVGLRLAGNEVRERFSTTFAAEEVRDDSAEGRIELWQNLWALAVENPAVGIGPDAFGYVAPSFGWPLHKEGHNLWMQTAAELGFPALVFLVLFYVGGLPYLLRIARARAQTDEEQFYSSLAWACFASMVGFIVTAFFVSVARMEASYYVAMLGAIVLKLYPRVAAQPAPQPRPVAPRVPFGVVPAVAGNARLGYAARRP